MSTEHHSGYRPEEHLIEDDGDIVAHAEHDDSSVIFDPTTWSSDKNPFKATLPQIEIDDPEHVRLAVTLDDRAIALEGIMAYINKYNMTSGSAVQLGIEDSTFNQRYKNKAEQVYEGAKNNRHDLFDGFVRGIHILNATVPKQNMGIPADQIRLDAISLKSAINKEFATPGNAPKRHKAVRRAKKAAMRSHKPL